MGHTRLGEVPKTQKWAESSQAYLRIGSDRQRRYR